MGIHKVARCVKNPLNFMGVDNVAENSTKNLLTELVQ